eukprot:TRINITY_DN9826_c0_g1_i1.p1 TRINITY_DN9826_c0_g1~~TRINITY_DN9826_c0_g1_i1.p1  ORF type:complete len:105 (-),score=18.05 TRINITY_DN9826_c0_g1_i1:27-341(-)
MDENKDVNEIINRLKQKKGVESVMVANHDGALIESTTELNTSRKYTKLLTELVKQASDVIKKMQLSKDSNDLSFMTLRTKQHEIMIYYGEKYLFFTLKSNIATN